MDKFRECVASVARMCLFCAIGGVLAVFGEMRHELIIAVVFMLLAGNELLYIVMIVVDYRRELMPKTKSRKKSKKDNYLRHRMVYVICFELLAGLILWILYCNGVEINAVSATIAICTALIISLLV